MKIPTFKLLSSPYYKDSFLIDVFITNQALSSKTTRLVNIVRISLQVIMVSNLLIPLISRVKWCFLFSLPDEILSSIFNWLRSIPLVWAIDTWVNCLYTIINANGSLLTLTQWSIKESWHRKLLAKTNSTRIKVTLVANYSIRVFIQNSRFFNRHNLTESLNSTEA